MNYNKSHKNQIFTPIDAVAVLALMAVVFWSVGTILSNSVIENGVSHAKLDTESLSAQLSFEGVKILPVKGVQRKLASKTSQKSTIGFVGTIGRDPWGEAYNYRIIEMEKSPIILVWSNGPDKISNTNFEKILDLKSRAAGKHFSHNDDIAFARLIQ